MENKKQLTEIDILSKHTGEVGIYLTKGMVKGSDALEAMSDFASQEVSRALEGQRKLYAISDNKVAILNGEIQTLRKALTEINNTVTIGTVWKIAEQALSSSTSHNSKD